MPAVAAIVVAEAVTATMVAAAVAQVGIAMSVVGAVTGSKSLMKIGAVMSLAGGITNMALGMAEGTAGVAAETAGTAAGSEATGEALDLFYGTDAATQSMMQSTAQTMPIGETMIQAGTDLAPVGTAAGTEATSQPLDLFKGAESATTAATTEAAMPLPAAQIEAPAATATSAPTTGAPQPIGVSAPATPTVGNTASIVNTATDLANKAKQTGIWDDFKAWYGKLDSKEKLLVGQLGFGAIQGAASAYGQSEQMDYTRQRDERFNRNANTVIPIVNRGGLMTSGVK